MLVSFDFEFVWTSNFSVEVEASVFLFSASEIQVPFSIFMLSIVFFFGI